jgi:hypothetical protein
MLGDAKRLPDGGVITSWTMFGTILDIGPEGDVRWSLETELGVATGRTTWLPTLP